jgi:hypothetical protein
MTASSEILSAVAVVYSAKNAALCHVMELALKQPTTYAYTATSVSMLAPCTPCVAVGIACTVLEESHSHVCSSELTSQKFEML